MRMPVSSVLNIKGVGDVVTGRIEQGKVEIGSYVTFLPTHSSATPCTGRIFSLEMHHKNVPVAMAGDNVGIMVKELPKTNMPRAGDVMVHRNDESITRVAKFTVQVHVLNHPGELKVGYTPVGYVRTGRSAIRLSEIKWKIGKETGNTKVENPGSLKANEMAEVVFEPNQPIVVETFKNCEGLGRVAIMEGTQVVMLGKIVSVEYKTSR